ncbi:MAG: nucleoside deaminase [Candidatus Sericytochromatia bacterium]
MNKNLEINQINLKKDINYMILALKKAKISYIKNEVPVGAIIVFENKVIATGYNKKDSKNDITAHAEIEAIKKAQKKLGTWRLNNCSLYVTLEPCPMCAGAIIQSRVSKIVYGAKNNFYGSFGTIIALEKLFPDAKNIEIIHDVLSDECSDLLKKFFSEKRKLK